MPLPFTSWRTSTDWLKWTERDHCRWPNEIISSGEGALPPSSEGVCVCVAFAEFAEFSYSNICTIRHETCEYVQCGLRLVEILLIWWKRFGLLHTNKSRAFWKKNINSQLKISKNGWNSNFEWAIISYNNFYFL